MQLHAIYVDNNNSESCHSSACSYYIDWTLSFVQGEKARLNEDGGKRGGGGGGGRTDRTTRMLVALLGLFLATELPQAIFGLLTAIAPHLFTVCYYAFGESPSSLNSHSIVT